MIGNINDQKLGVRKVKYVETKKMETSYANYPGIKDPSLFHYICNTLHFMIKGKFFRNVIDYLFHVC
jgi:hypothetical protein